MAEHTSVRQLAHAAQQTQEWLNDLGRRPPFENQEQAYSLLRAVLHAVRDRLTAEEAAHLGSQLPMLVRGFYFEGWRPVLAPNDYSTAEAFFERVESSLGGGRRPAQIDVVAGTRTVLEFLADHVDPGEMRHVVRQMPTAIEELFPESARA